MKQHFQTLAQFFNIFLILAKALLFPQIHHSLQAMTHGENVEKASKQINLLLHPRQYKHFYSYLTITLI